MVSCDWFRMTWTSKNLMWKFNFDTCLLKSTLTYDILVFPMIDFFQMKKICGMLLLEVLKEFQCHH
jgi:hypothetical protein